jgi:ankyrin repeat protein
MDDAPQPRTDDGEQLTAAQLDFLASVFDLVREGETATVLGLLDRRLPVNLTNSKGDTLLILAAYHKHAELVRALLERGADTARVNDRGQTALAAAVFRSSAKIVRDLLDAGGDPQLGDPDAVAVATFFELPEMATLLGAPR